MTQITRLEKLNYFWILESMTNILKILFMELKYKTTIFLQQVQYLNKHFPWIF